MWWTPTWWANILPPRERAEDLCGTKSWSIGSGAILKPLALIRQEEYISEPEPGVYIHMKELRVTEWPVEFLRRPRRTANTIPDFLSPTAPVNRLDILRGLAPPRGS